MKSLESDAQHSATVPSADRIREPRIGKVVSVQPGRVLVEFQGNTRGPLAARLAASLAPDELARAAREQPDAVLLFADGDPTRPILVNLLQPESLSPLTDNLLAELPTAHTEQKEVLVDGRRIILEGSDEVVLRCGKASLTLRRNGQIVLRGVNIRSDADEVHRIRGGTVQIN